MRILLDEQRLLEEYLTPGRVAESCAIAQFMAASPRLKTFDLGL
jgi:hypothetical protein